MLELCRGVRCITRGNVKAVAISKQCVKGQGLNCNTQLNQTQSGVLVEVEERSGGLGGWM